MPKDKNAQAAYILNPNNHDIVELGKSIYVQNCASCHGAKLEGQKIGCQDRQMDRGAMVPFFRSERSDGVQHEPRVADGVLEEYMVCLAK